MKFNKVKNQSHGPSSSLGIMSFSDPRKSLIRLSPELVIIAAVVIGLVVLILQYI